MSKKASAGILLYRGSKALPEFFLIHPGGPFWKNKDLGAWSIPKGEMEPGEDGLSAAKREFEEETGFSCSGEFHELAPVKLKSGKIVYAWAVEMDVDPARIKSNMFQLEWPPKSGKMLEVPEIDKAGWFTLAEAEQKLNPAQLPLLREVVNSILHQN